jgi:hypothetical protein
LESVSWPKEIRVKRGVSEAPEKDKVHSIHDEGIEQCGEKRLRRMVMP